MDLYYNLALFFHYHYFVLSCNILLLSLLFPGSTSTGPCVYFITKTSMSLLVHLVFSSFFFSGDRIPPVVNCPADREFEVAFGETGRRVNWSLPTVTDNSGTTTFFVSSTTTPNDFFPVGSSTITYTYRDASYNTNSCSFTVVIVEGENLCFCSNCIVCSLLLFPYQL